MITFNPGPSHLTKTVINCLHEIVDSGLLSQSHRSEDFRNIFKGAIYHSKNALHIPADFHLVFSSSASAAMDCILRNCVSQGSFHFVHGAFSKRFFDFAKALYPSVNCMESAWDLPVPFEDAKISDDCEMIAITHNETSTGLMWPISAIEKVREKYPKPLLCLDVTSSLAGAKIPWDSIDIAFASVQKCLGMPPGLALMIVNERCLEKIRENKRENDGGIPSIHNLLSICEKAKSGQTLETPNMLLIATLNRIMQEFSLRKTLSYSKQKATLLYTGRKIWKPYIEDPKWRSSTVCNFQVANEQAGALREFCESKGYLVGKGYGDLKNSCVRIANFPSIDIPVIEDFLNLIQCFDRSMN